MYVIVVFSPMLGRVDEDVRVRATDVSSLAIKKALRRDGVAPSRSCKEDEQVRWTLEQVIIKRFHPTFALRELQFAWSQFQDACAERHRRRLWSLY